MFIENNKTYQTSTQNGSHRDVQFFYPLLSHRLKNQRCGVTDTRTTGRHSHNGLKKQWCGVRDTRTTESQTQI